MAYLIDDTYLFTGDTIWLGADGGYSFINALAEDIELEKRSLAILEKKLRERHLNPIIITGHTGYSDDINFSFAHRDEGCNSNRQSSELLGDSEADYCASSVNSLPLCLFIAIYSTLYTSR